MPCRIVNERAWKADREREKQQRLAAEADQRRAHEARQRAAEQARDRAHARELSDTRDRLAKIERRQQAARTALGIRQEAARRQAMVQQRVQVLQTIAGNLARLMQPPPEPVEEDPGVSLLDRLQQPGS